VESVGVNKKGDIVETVIAIDLQIDDWKIPEARAYRKAVGVNPEYALQGVQQAFTDAEAESRTEFGEKVDEEGWQPPDGWLPSALLNIAPDYLLGFAWVAARRADPALDYEAFAESVPYGGLVAGFWEAIMGAAEEVAGPLVPSRAERRKRGPASRTASSLATTSTGRSPKPTSSPSASSPRPSKSSTRQTVRNDGD